MKAYPALDMDTVYVDSYDAIESLADDYDYIVCTLYATVKYCAFNGKRAKIVYYIQDFEPFFFDRGTAEYKEALASYTLLDDAVLVTKTQWNRDVVKKYTGRDCHVIGPSVNVFELVKPDVHSNGDPVRITAMIRPSSPRRAPDMSYRILRSIKKKYGQRVSISIFGSDPEQNAGDFMFFCSEPQDFEYVNYGRLTREQVSQLLADSDIFADFSNYQAMGLTAMEAMSAGCAVVITKHGGATEFAEDGVNALLVDSLCPEDCEKAVCRLIEDDVLRAGLIEKAAEDIRTYSPGNAAAKLLEAINQ